MSPKRVDPRSILKRHFVDTSATGEERRRIMRFHRTRLEHERQTDRENASLERQMADLQRVLENARLRIDAYDNAIDQAVSALGEDDEIAKILRDVQK